MKRRHILDCRYTSNQILEIFRDLILEIFRDLGLKVTDWIVSKLDLKTGITKDYDLSEHVIMLITNILNNHQPMNKTQ